MVLDRNKSTSMISNEKTMKAKNFKIERFVVYNIYYYANIISF